MTVATNLSTDLLRQMYERMLTIRRFEEDVARLFQQGRLPGFAHISIGQEAVAVGACSALEQDDYITSTHRGHGHVIAKGGELRPMFAELFARTTGYCKGKGGSMHIAAMDLGILGANGIVGAGLPISCGAAFSSQQLGTGRVAASFFGDGAANESTFGESLNLAGVWKLPVVFVCEDNAYGLSNPRAVHLAGGNVASRAQAYGIPAAVVDGMDVLAVYEAAGEAVKRARAGDGPSLLDCRCYRFAGHYEGDDAAYRPAGELDQWRARDPVTTFRLQLIERGLMTQEEADELDRRLAAEVEDAIRFGETSPWPEPSELYTDVYSNPFPYPR